MPKIADRITDWFCTKKGAERKKVVERMVDQRKLARRELDKAIEDLTQSRSSPWPSSRRLSGSGR